MYFMTHYISQSKSYENLIFKLKLLNKLTFDHFTCPLKSSDAENLENTKKKSSGIFELLKKKLAPVKLTEFFRATERIITKSQ